MSLLSFRVNGDPTAATLLTPTFTHYKNVATGADIVAEVVSELDNGQYTFTVDWSAVKYTGVDSVSFVIDGGVAIPTSNERYIVGRISRYDNFGFQTDTIYEVTLGRWTVAANQLVLYKQDAVTVVKTFDLFDSTGAPTEIIPATRIPV